jgi:hypothetical protein
MAAEDEFGRRTAVSAADHRRPRRLVARHRLTLFSEIERADLRMAYIARICPL